ncbi:hypothetical protein Dimus_016100 [Dionaea muscipula]
MKAAEYLEQAEYDAGNPEDDSKTKSLMTGLLFNPKFQAACSYPGPSDVLFLTINLSDEVVSVCCEGTM